MKITIFIVDDHPIVADGMKMLLQSEDQFTVCGIADNIEDAMTKINSLRPDLVIVDINLKGQASGLDLIKAIAKRTPNIKSIALSMHDEELYAERAVRAGAMGYIKKSELTRTLISALRQVMGGKMYLSENMSRRINERPVRIEAEERSNPLDALTDREIEILRFIGRGYKIKEIGRILNLSVKTIDNHRTNIRQKLDLKNASELLRFAVEWMNNPSK
jgi:DNA-binding NarL/FixJ family response regulator